MTRTKALIKRGPKPRTDVATPAALTAEQIDAVRLLAREGVREMSMRRVLGLTPVQWKALRADQADGELSPLSLALAEGIAEGQADVIAFMKRRMTQENDFQAASWLADRVFKLAREEGNDAAPRVSIVINAAMTPEDYARMVEVRQS
jgi:hypothetical protein